MKTNVLLFKFLFVITAVHAQFVDRISVKGEIYALANDVEGVTVFNASSNQGTITDEKGTFILDVAENDIIQISALQFQPLSVTVTKDVIKSRQLKIHLVEQIHKLDAVLLSSGLTGNINTDIENVAYIKPIILDMGSMNVDYEYNDEKPFDEKSVEYDLKSRISKGELYNGFDLGKISQLIFGKKNKKYKKPEYITVEKPFELTDLYTPQYISEMFNIPLNKVNAFIAYVDTQDLDAELLEKGNEIKCLQFLYEKSKQFLNTQNAKN
ncbi:hypothetical protein FUA26_13130 [Seonamhaeicola algicola]|uniref:Carboxypeptidase-like regulatory domain-containing protein n=1 Tax=Seonamhaeicola algicola TaxID=1719036 RepID=A0A5C7AMV5_9FLAO|nr:carboxypeptidase-like regulatory domain-containing protein [Seonamhaeicola algicola]TXE07162.1 hypothetical protein FUA26_13130 [Seonamhaeicola algicola]